MKHIARVSVPRYASAKVEENPKCDKCVSWQLRLGRDNSEAGLRCNEKKGCSF